MTQTHNSESKEEFTLSTNINISILLVYGIVLMLESIFFIFIGAVIIQVTGVPGIPINPITIGSLLLGAAIFTYYYHTRYVKRTLIIGKDTVELKIGKREFKYNWSDFTIVALSVSYAAYGAKGFMIKLFEDDLEGEYIDLPIYKFPKKGVDVFDLRNQIQEKLRLIHSKDKE